MVSQEGYLAVIATFFAFGAISIALYLFVLRPVNEAPAQGERGNNNPVIQQRRPAQQQPAVNNNATANNRSSDSSSANIDKILAKCAKSPSHVAESYQKKNGASLLSDGLVAFRYTKAASAEQASKPPSGEDATAQNRKERARALSKMLALEGGSADAGSFSRGSTFVVSVPLEEAGCPKLRRVLWLFSTYYNLLVILVVPSGVTPEALENAKSKLRGGDSDADRLDTSVLPNHRFIAASTATGRIAVVRQLSRAEIVLDFDNEVKSQLSRFGYRVINYANRNVEKGSSQLGSQLVSS
ncbi:expressed unknown protein [Seminavis robusta]|uniref:Uncharacterized protein n=1 Tax=Seminavis robusta TaxID=568900 RepID=A0A9N8DNC4_9STRA|nr:expressed unknown protein [Seminavis robusta]|eukprot:Sro151_g069080.1 n/a (298) ;mRNA; r:27574-28467